MARFAVARRIRTHDPVDQRAMSESHLQSDAILVNGEARGLPEGGALSVLLAELGLAGKRLAVAVNREVVPRSRWGACTLAPGDRVEILEAVGGGA